MKTQSVPGYHTATPYLTVQDGAAAILFYQEAFGAEEVMRLEDDDGKIRTRGAQDRRLADHARR